MKVNEQKFYNALENIFTGAKVEGDSGYVNLLKIKEIYYCQILEKFKTEVSENDLIEGFKEEFFDKLYSFFEKYFSENGSVYFVKTANWQRVYEKVYTDNKDVVLFWKTHMLYYVKSDILFQSINVEIQDDKTGETHYFYFDVGDLKQKQNNEKRQIIFEYFDTKTEKIDDNKEKKKNSFKVSYSERGRKTKKDEILKKVKIREEILDKAFNIFKKQSEVDFFINKNAKKFLTEQLDIYLHQILLHEENKFVQRRLDQIKTIKEFAGKIIDFISQFEDELVKIWNKPKFAKDSNYVITLDKLSKEIIGKLSKHKNLKEQIAEWHDLGMVKKGFDFNDIFDDDFFNDFKKEFQYLPIDSKYFKDLEIDILSLFDNLDEALDGRLIHSENYQALNTLQNKYKEKIQCIYIDPPYNAPASEIIYANNYKHSSWLTLMDNRIQLAKKFLTKDGVFECAIDENEQENLGKILKSIFPDCEHTCVSIIHNPAGVQGDNFSYSHEYCFFIFKKDKKLIGKTERIEESEESFRDWGGTSSRLLAKNCFYPILVKKEKIIGFGDVCSDSFHPESSNVAKGNTIYVYPVKNQDERKWVFSRNSVEKIANELNVRKRGNEVVITRTKTTTSYKTVWNDKKFYANIYGSKLLNNIIGRKTFDFPKSIYAVRECLNAVNSFKETNSYCLDFFAGSGTTAQAVINLNRKDGKKRKYILVELGNHFSTTIIPRIKKICFSEKWKEGKAQDSNGISQFFKYYSLEQYEETLRNSKYSQDQEFMIWDANKSPFEQYIFFADNKIVDVLEAKKEEIQLNFDNLYPNIDLPETISNLLGLQIKQITKENVILLDGDDEREIRTDVKQMTEDERIEFVRLLKPLLWWGK